MCNNLRMSFINEYAKKFNTIQFDTAFSCIPHSKFMFTHPGGKTTVKRTLNQTKKDVFIVRQPIITQGKLHIYFLLYKEIFMYYKFFTF